MSAKRRMRSVHSVQPAVTQPKRLVWLYPFAFGSIIAGLAVFLATHSASTNQNAPIPAGISTAAASPHYPTLAEFAEMTSQQLGQQDLALLNLRCAEELPGSEHIDVAKCLRTVGEWAERVDHETNRHLYKFRQNPSEYENSEGYFRMLMLITVLQQDFGVRYNPQRIHEPDFRNSCDLFIHGMIGDQNGGTCASMPVLYTAVARRLGYPVHLVLAKAHVFCRWEGKGERFNIEGAGLGMNKFDDAYYEKWPIPITKAEMDRGHFLRNLTPREELALFLSSRGYCLEDNDRLAEAYVSYAQAYRLGSENPEYLVGLKIAINKRLMPLAQLKAPVFLTPPPVARRHVPPPTLPATSVPYQVSKPLTSQSGLPEVWERSVPGSKGFFESGQGN